MSDPSQSNSTEYNDYTRTSVLSRFTPKRGLMLGGGVLVLALIGLLVVSGSKGSSDPGTYETAKVIRGSMIISVKESGEVEAKNNMKVANELPYPVVIKSVVPEGTVVKPGDLIIELQCDELETQLTTQHLAVSSAQSTYTEAKETLTQAQNQLPFIEEMDKQKIQLAEEELTRYEQGGGPLDIKNAESTVTIARSQLALAEARLQFKQDVNADPELNSPYSANDIKNEQLTVEQLKVGLDKALKEQEILTKYDFPNKVGDLKVALNNAKLQLNKDLVDARLALSKAQAYEKSANETLAKQTDRLSDLEEYAKKLKIFARGDGLVVYGPPPQQRWRYDFVVDAKERIDPNRQIIYVPDMSTLRVSTKVYESMIDQVKPGLKAYVQLDRDTAQRLPATVIDMSPLPDQQWGTSTKIFKVYVKLDGTPTNLRPNGTAQVEIELARLPEDTLSVPVAAIFSEKSHYYCYRVSHGREQKVEVQIGRRSSQRVQILGGLSEGDEVRLWEPKSSKSAKDKTDQKTPAGNAAF